VFVSSGYARLHPLYDFCFKPPHSAGAERYPLGKLPVRFKAGDVSRRVKYQCAYILLRQKLHHELHCWRFANLGLRPETAIKYQVLSKVCSQRS
jgi:hypothetical protein